MLLEADTNPHPSIFPEATAGFAARIGNDFVAAMREVAHLEDVLEAACDFECDQRDDKKRREATRAVDVASAVLEAALEYVLALPVHSHDTFLLKAEFALRFCEDGHHLKKALADVIVFMCPQDAASRLPKWLAAR